MNNKIKFFMGIDVQINRGCAYFIVNKDAVTVNSGWVSEESFQKTGAHLHEVALSICGNSSSKIAVGIDAPRMALPSKRKHYWDRKTVSWRKRRRAEKGYGRHCEVIIKSLGIANPQWTPIQSECPAWMQLGFEIFQQLKEIDFVFEVFPSASYKILQGNTDLKATIDFSAFFKGPKDMLDACMAAMTVYEYIHGRGAEVGDGDGLGSIVLPRPIVHEKDLPLLSWPD